MDLLLDLASTTTNGLSHVMVKSLHMPPPGHKIQAIENVVSTRHWCEGSQQTGHLSKSSVRNDSETRQTVMREARGGKFGMPGPLVAVNEPQIV